MLGKMYYQVYETDDQYTSWCLSRLELFAGDMSVTRGELQELV